MGPAYSRFARFGVCELPALESVGGDRQGRRRLIARAAGKLGTWKPRRRTEADQKPKRAGRVIYLVGG